MYRRNVKLSEPSLLYNSSHRIVDKLNLAQRSAPPNTLYRTRQVRKAYFNYTIGGIRVYEYSEV